MATYGLEFSDIYGRVQDYANINNVEGSATKAKKAVNDALRRIASERRWLALRRTGEITPVASTQSYALSGLTGFNYPVRVYYIDNGIEIPIDIVSEEEWSQKSDNDSDGTPAICAFLNLDGSEKLYLSPRPSASFVSQHSTIYVDHDKKPTELSNDTDVPEIPNTNSQMALVYYAVAELCLKQGDFQAALGWEAKAKTEFDKFVSNDIHFRGLKKKKGKPTYGILHKVNSNANKDY